MVDGFQDWNQNKSKYLTEDTIKTIESDWRDYGHELIILNVLYELWLTIEKRNENWNPILAQKSVNFATNGAWGRCAKGNRSFSLELVKMVNAVRTYYLFWKDR